MLAGAEWLVSPVRATNTSPGRNTNAIIMNELARVSQHAPGGLARDAGSARQTGTAPHRGANWLV
jgi:hypothetical protein